MKIHFKDLASRLTGISLPIFGISWNPPESERKVVRDILVFLEDRRALYNDFAHEIEDQVTTSVLQIRSELTNAMPRMRPKTFEYGGAALTLKPQGMRGPQFLPRLVEHSF